MKAARALLLFLVLPAAWAADPPESVYTNFHRSVLAGNAERMMLYLPAAQRKEMASMSPAQRAFRVKSIAAQLPRTYVIQAKTVDGGGLSMHLSGMSTPLKSDQQSEMLYGSIRMRLEGQDWKVGSMNWSNKPHTGAAQGKAPPPVAAVKPAFKPAPGETTAKPAVRSGGTLMGTTPERKLGTAKPPCVYKPAMTAEDLENFR